ncbi:hypothetical protein BDC45DRAFT_533867 [Circinella umbellata]|nr:hypothetical protein BDC45DRAFT_533867 [Circinella umbellata]
MFMDANSKIKLYDNIKKIAKRVKINYDQILDPARRLLLHVAESPLTSIREFTTGWKFQQFQHVGTIGPRFTRGILSCSLVDYKTFLTNTEYFHMTVTKLVITGAINNIPLLETISSFPNLTHFTIKTIRSALPDMLPHNNPIVHPHLWEQITPGSVFGLSWKDVPGSNVFALGSLKKWASCSILSILHPTNIFYQIYQLAEMS